MLFPNIIRPHLYLLLPQNHLLGGCIPVRSWLGYLRRGSQLDGFYIWTSSGWGGFCWHIWWCRRYHDAHNTNREETYVYGQYGGSIWTRIRRWTIARWCIHHKGDLAMVLLHQPTHWWSDTWHHIAGVEAPELEECSNYDQRTNSPP